MSDGDLGRFLEEAFDKIEPRDDAHRERLAKMREKLRAMEAEHSIEMQKVRAELAQMRETGKVDLDRIRQRKTPALEMWDGLLAACDEQTALLGRIAEATKKNRSSR